LSLIVHVTDVFCNITSCWSRRRLFHARLNLIFRHVLLFVEGATRDLTLHHSGSAEAKANQLQNYNVIHTHQRRGTVRQQMRTVVDILRFVCFSQAEASKRSAFDGQHSAALTLTVLSSLSPGKTCTARTNPPRRWPSFCLNKVRKACDVCTACAAPFVTTRRGAAVEKQRVGYKRDGFTDVQPTAIKVVEKKQSVCSSQLFVDESFWLHR